MKNALISALLALNPLVLSASAAELPARPPQFVALAFDGSQSIGMWQATRAFSKAVRDQGAPFGFTYFISGVYYLEAAQKKHYQGPGFAAGVSSIGFGADSKDILARVAQTNSAFDEGNEIGSHANGHFDGSKWTAQQWTTEFSLFTDLIFGVFTNNGLQSADPSNSTLHFAPKDVTGFRAPLLGTSPGLWTTLKEQSFRYDTSKVSTPSYWPEKRAEGFWNFPLASLTIAGLGKSTLSMDYNFYVAQSAAKPDAANSAKYEQQMLATYLNYFQKNYDGNRAPLHIGHHFSQWNGGAYWRAMQAFAKSVCVRPEVKCVTYTQLADFMDTLDAQTLEAYRKGQFDRTGMPGRAVNPSALRGAKLESAVTEDYSNERELTPDEISALGLLPGDVPEAH